MKEKICTILVTFNREKLLKECVLALQKQSKKPDCILVVNNSSTDGTLEMLKEFNVQILNLNENTGSSGGFHNGIKWAFERKFDWVWLMDDDGLPVESTLQKLLDAKENQSDGKIFNSLVRDKENPSKIAFGYNWKLNLFYKKEEVKFFENVVDLKKVISDNILDGFPQFFNSSLIHRDAIKKIGYPIHNLFIRGDEVEYAFRAQKNGFKTYTVFDSIFYHPNPTIKKMNFWGLSFQYEPMQSWKHYYAMRNLIIIDRLYGDKFQIFIRILKIIIKEFLIEVKSKEPLRAKFHKISTTLKAVFNGLRFPINHSSPSQSLL
ncbi:MAG: glycosyltransferase family 2 protein [bacterium]